MSRSTCIPLYPCSNRRATNWQQFCCRYKKHVDGNKWIHFVSDNMCPGVNAALVRPIHAVTCSAHFALQCTDLCIANISYFICLLIAFSDFQIGGLTQHYSSVSASWWVLRPWNFSKQENSVIKLLKRHGRSISSQPSLKVPRIHSTCLILIILIHTKACVA